MGRAAIATSRRFFRQTTMDPPTATSDDPLSLAASLMATSLPTIDGATGIDGIADCAVYTHVLISEQHVSV